MTGPKVIFKNLSQIHLSGIYMSTDLHRNNTFLNKITHLIISHY